MQYKAFYHCLKNNFFEDAKHFQLIPIRMEDIELIRVWRNAQIAILRQNSALSKEDQISYFQNIIFPSTLLGQPPQILFSFLFKKVLIGYGGLVHIAWEDKRAEVSFLVDPKRSANQSIYANDLLHFLNLICYVSFKELSLHRLTTETFAFRKNHIALCEAFGFKYEGILRKHVFKQNQWTDSILHGLLSTEAPLLDPSIRPLAAVPFV